MAYSIGGNDFSTYNMNILSSMGALDFPKRLGEVDHDWKDSNGVEAFVETNDLLWDGRDIQLMAFYEGSNMITDLGTFRGLYEGVNAALVTTYGSHTAILKDIKVQNVFSANAKALLILKFWEPVVTVPSPPAATGGSGPSLGGYDFLQDFGLRIESVKGLNDVVYRKKELTHGNQAVQLSDNRKNRVANIHMNGVYSSIGNLISAITDLHGVLRSVNLKVLAYRGSNFNTYFADLSRVTAIPAHRAVTIRLKLRIEE